MAQAARDRQHGSVRQRYALVVGAVALAIGAAGCGNSPSSGSVQAAKTPAPNAPEVNPAGDIPDTQAYVPYSPPGAGFSVSVPEGWSRSTSGAMTSFSDKLNSIRIETTPASAALTVIAAKQTVLPKLASTVKGYQPGTVTTVSRKAGNAIRITYQAAAPPDAVTGKSIQDAVERYTFFHNGNDVTLTLTGPKGADNVDPWKIVTDSLVWSA